MTKDNERLCFRYPEKMGPLIDAAMLAARNDYEVENSPPNVKCWYPWCDKLGHLYRRHTSYADDQSNWGIACDEHRKEDDDEMGYLWDEYYAGLL